MRSLNIWTYFLSNLLILCVNGQGIQTNSITGQITNLSDAKSQKIIEEEGFTSLKEMCASLIPGSKEALFGETSFYRQEFIQLMAKFTLPQFG